MQSNDGRIDISVRNSSNGNQTHFRIKPNQPFTKLIKTYCAKENLSVNSVVFSFDTQRILSDKTPHDYDITDGSVIEAFVNYTAG